jgi:HlyD family secretion protein
MGHRRGGMAADTSHAHGEGGGAGGWARGGAGGTGSTAGWAGGNGGGRTGGTFAAGGFGSGRKNRTPPARTYVLDSPTTMHAVTLRAGLSDGSFTEILDGDLKEGQDVVTSVSMAGSGARPATATPPGFGGAPGGGGGGGRGR